MSFLISRAFDSGNIEVIEASHPEAVRLSIVPDEGGEHFQWFHFRVVGARDQALNMAIENAGQASYPKGWEGYQACASYDRETWFRVPTSYADGKLVIAHRPAHDAVYYAYFAPYSQERHRDLIARSVVHPASRLEVLGRTLDGRDLDLLQLGEPDGHRLNCWVIARQHPGESMAEWLVEGLLERLLDTHDPLSRKLLAEAVFHVVPNMNPDGSRRGHLRTNAAGANLNREWAEPTMERSPEVYLVRQKMRQTGVDFCLDVHGDEALPYNFIAGPDGVADLPNHVLAGRDAFEAALVRASPDFQTEHGYPKAPVGKANLTMATNHIADHFGAVSMTLEQPFKDNANLPDGIHGWSPARCRLLGRAQLDALHAIVPLLRQARG